MGFFNGVRNHYRKRRAVAVVQNLLEHQTQTGSASANPGKIATLLVHKVWASNPHLFTDRNAEAPPGPASTAAVALAIGARDMSIGSPNRAALLKALAELLQSGGCDPAQVSLNPVDHLLLQGAARSLADMVRDATVSPIHVSEPKASNPRGRS